MSPPAPDKDSTSEAMFHFSTAILFLITGLVALFLNSGRLADGDFLDAKVVGGIHFITLGWLSLSIFGALRVFIGVALGSQGLKSALVPWIRYLWTLGALVFPLGLILELKAMIISGVHLIGVALILFTIHIVPALLQAKRGAVTRWFLVIALISLWGAWLLGMLAGLVRAGIGTVAIPPGYFSSHLLLATFGWVGATVVGVGSHLIPMFALSTESNMLPVKSALVLWFFIPVFAGLGAFFNDPYIDIGWGLAAVGSLLWMVQVFLYFRGRLRREYDPGLMLAGGATILLGIAWVVILSTGATLSFVGLILIGWLTLFTLGIYHRVVPFLVWFARFARTAGKGPVPKVKDLTNWKISMATLVLSLTGALIWGTGLFAGLAALTYSGSGMILLSVLLSLAQLKTLIGSPSTTITKKEISV